MGEKGRLAVWAAGFLGMAVFCIGAALLPGERAPEAGRGESVPAAGNGGGGAGTAGWGRDGRGSSAPSGRIAGPVDEALAADIVRAFAEAGTPFFEDPASLTLPQMEEAAIWLMIERGEMPGPEGGKVYLAGGTLMGWIETVFGLSGLPPEDCAFGEYDAESDRMVLPAAAFFPVYAPVAGEAEADGEGFVLPVSLLSPRGGKGTSRGTSTCRNRSGRRYWPSKTAGSGRTGGGRGMISLLRSGDE